MSATSAPAPASAPAVAPASAPAVAHDARSRAAHLYAFAQKATLEQFLAEFALINARGGDNVHTLLAYFSSFDKISFASSPVAPFTSINVKDGMIPFDSPLLKEKVETFKYVEKTASDAFKAWYLLNKEDAILKKTASVWVDSLNSHPKVQADAKIIAMIENGHEPSIKDLLDALVRPSLKRCNAVYKTASSIGAKKNIHVAGAQCSNPVCPDLELPNTCFSHAPEHLKTRAKFLKAKRASDTASANLLVAKAALAAK
jgi:hypothetical protein